MSKKYSISFYTGGVKIEQWDELTEDQKEKALSKYWYLRWSYRNPSTLKLERQQNYKGGVNFYKTKEERLRELKESKKVLIQLLKDDYSPFNDKDKIILDFIETEKLYNIKEALNLALTQIKLTVSKNTHNDYTKSVNAFLKFLKKDNHHKDVKLINKKIVQKFLEDILKKSSARNHNNYKSNLSAVFTKLVKMDIIGYNFIKDIDKLKSTSKKNTSFTQNELKDLFALMKKNNIWLYYFCIHVYYGLFRNIEVVRIRIEDINLKDQLIKSKTKTGNFYKQIPNVLISEFYSKLDLSTYNDKDLLFTKNDAPGEWLTSRKSETDETNRRSYIGKKFRKEVLNKLGFSSDYTIYSLRHSAIGIYFLRRLDYFKEKGDVNFEEKALNSVRTITLHKSNEVVKNYLREIGYYKIEDWSDFLI